MNKYQTPCCAIIEGYTVEGAIRKLREQRGQTDSYYDFVYNWDLHSDGIHLKDKKMPPVSEQHPIVKQSTFGALAAN